MKEKTFVSAVVYVYNAEKVILGFLHELDSTLSAKFEIYEIIVVNDASTDGTRQVIKQAGKEISGTLTVLNLAWRHKKELAMLAGTDLAIGDFVYELESCRPDYEWSLLPQLYDKSVTGFDVVYAYPQGQTRHKSRLFYWLLNRMSHVNVDSATETVKIISRKALNRALLERGKVRYRKILYKYCGFPTTSLYYNPIKCEDNTVDMTLLQKAGLAADVFIVFSNIGTQIAMVFSTIWLLLSAFIGIYALLAYLNGKTTVSGWTTTMLFLSIGFSGLFLTITVLAKYISTILLEQRQSSLYTVEAIDKVNKN